MLFLKHGVHVVDDTADALRSAVSGETMSALQVGAPAVETFADDATTPFDYLLDGLNGDAGAHLPATDPAAMVAALSDLGRAMAEAAPAALPNSTIPPVYTYWGQFIDHDMTANTDANIATIDITRPDLAPLDPNFVTSTLRNLRRPGLDLDSLYGDGPAAVGGTGTDAAFYDGIKFRIGSCFDVGGLPIPPAGEFDRDQPRIGVLLDAGVLQLSDFTAEQQAEPNFRTMPLIGDTRNDENLIISQFHLAMMKFHNKVVDALVARGHLARYGFGRRRRAEMFRHARQLVRWHYQWLTVHDYLKTVTRAGVADKVLLARPRHYRPRHGEAYMPLEYSAAAYRYGHSMVRAKYDHNRNFTAATFEQLFEFTGNGHVINPAPPPAVISQPFRGLPSLPSNWIIEWNRFTDKGSSVPERFARRIDTHIALPLTTLINAANDHPPTPISTMMKQLAVRNLLRGYLLALPTGQAAATAMGVTPLSVEEVRQGASPETLLALAAGGFAERTPLWYYILKEAEVRCNGNTMGQLGSTIVCETIIGQLYADDTSYLGQKGWDPADSPLRCADGTPITTIRDLLRFAGVAPPSGPADE